MYLVKCILCIIYQFVGDIYNNAGHAGQPDQPVADEHRGGGHADHGRVHPLQCAHVHHEGQIRDLRAKSTDIKYIFIPG